MKIAVLGSTGSIGRQTLEVAGSIGAKISALAANRSTGLLEEQARRYRPEVVAVAEESATADLKVRLADTDIKVLPGQAGLCEAAADTDADCVVSAIMGTAGLLPTMAAIKDGRRVALANKETLVCAGSIVMAAVKEYGAELLPVDSEHSAIFQCLMSGKRDEVRRIILTGSGGPFRGRKREELKNVRPEDALKHPNWSMGAKITVDSATLMNKGLEFIEAMHLFQVEPGDIRVLIHPQSIIHSMVEFRDNSVIAQLGMPDMRIPIQLALTWPNRVEGPAPELNFMNISELTFEEPDIDAFPCLGLAMELAPRRDNSHAVMNAANEAAVGMFLRGEIGFCDIYERVALSVEKLSGPANGLEDILEVDRQTREFVRSL